jgi:hypothetical protein
MIYDIYGIWRDSYNLTGSLSTKNYLIYQNSLITGMKPQSKLWKQIRELAAGYYTHAYAG